MYEEMQTLIPQDISCPVDCRFLYQAYAVIYFFVCQAWVTSFDRQYAYLSVFAK